MSERFRIAGWCHSSQKTVPFECWCLFWAFRMGSKIVFGTELSQKLSHEIFRAKKMLAKISISLQAFDFISNFLVVVGGLEPPTPAL